MLSLVGRSLDTSRRFDDALKILVGLRSTGRRQMARMLEQLVALTRDAARAVDAHDELELLAEPSTVMVVFRWRPAGRGSATTSSTPSTSRALLRCGRAIVGRTRLDGRVALKLTLIYTRSPARPTCGRCSISSRAPRAQAAALDAPPSGRRSRLSSLRCRVQPRTRRGSRRAVVMHARLRPDPPIGWPVTGGWARILPDTPARSMTTPSTRSFLPQDRPST